MAAGNWAVLKLSRQYPQIASRLILISIFLISLRVESGFRSRPQTEVSEAVAESELVASPRVELPFPASWARKVLTTKEGHRDPPMVRQWRRAPLISTMGGSNKQRAMVLSAARQLNQALDGTRIGKLQLAADPGPSDVTVYFVSNEQMKKRTGRDGVLGSVTTEIDSLGVISRAWIHIGDDSTEYEQCCVLLEELTQALGFLNDSDQVRSSIFYETVGDPGFIDELSEMDKKLIRFSYNFLNPGDPWAVVSQKLESYSWAGRFSGSHVQASEHVVEPRN